MTSETTAGARAAGPGAVFRVLAAHADGLTKTQVAELMGLSRTTVNQRLEPLIEAGLVVPTPESWSSGGRPADRFVINDANGVILVADMGASGMRTALCDLHAGVRLERYEPSDIARGPGPILGRVRNIFGELLEEAAIPVGSVRGIGIDVPGPVDHRSGRTITPPIMTGWHDFDIPGFFADAYSCPVVVEKDVNAMAFGEHRAFHADVSDMVYVKVGTGIGTGLILDGRIFRGADGAAGDVGHVQIDDGPAAPLCRCGRRGCIEAFAGGWALLRDLAEAGVPVDSVADAVRLTREGHPVATTLYRRAATVIGTAVSDLVNMVNPRVVVLGGQLAAVDDHLFAVVREVVYRRSLPLATRRLQLVPSRLGAKAGVYGLAGLVLDHIHDPARIDDLVAGVR